MNRGTPVISRVAIDPLANGLVDYLLDLSREIETLPAKELLTGQIAVFK